jgi:hypothetical protein
MSATIDEFESSVKIGITLFFPKKIISYNFQDRSKRLKQYVSKIIGHDPKWKYKTEFMEKSDFPLDDTLPNQDLLIGTEFYLKGTGIYRYGRLLTDIKGNSTDGFFAVSELGIKEIDEWEILMKDDHPVLKEMVIIEKEEIDKSRYAPDDIKF